MIGPFFASASTSCNNSFFFLPNWWEFLPKQPTPPACDINFTFPGDIWSVGLAILDMLLRVGGFVAVVSIIIAGIQYITATGPDKGTSARKRLTNSLIGLAIVLIASVTVKFIGNSIG